MAEKLKKSTIQIELTPEQKELVKQVTGKDVESLQLEELEERIAPGRKVN
jgi:hypothetical protein